MVQGQNLQEGFVAPARVENEGRNPFTAPQTTSHYNHNDITLIPEQQKSHQNK